MRELWNGFQCEKFTFEGRDAILVFPEEGTANSRLALKTEYWGAFPNVEIQLLKKGFHLGFVKCTSRFAPKFDCDLRAAFVRHVAKTYHLSEKCVPVGMSCGGAQAVRFAGFYPELVSCMYIDAPVLNYCDFPAKLRTPDLFEDIWQDEFLPVYPGMTRAKLLTFDQHPICMADTLLEHKIPIIMVWGIQDQTVYYNENGLLLEKAYEGTGLMQVIAVDDRAHHPHGTFHEDHLIVDFILNHE